jgi:hypothetical protein
MALIAVAADKGAPGVTTTSVALAAVWPRPVLLAECDPAGGDLVYRLPSAEGSRLDPRRGLISMAVAARHGLQPGQVWEHAQKLRGGLDVLVGVTNSEQGSGLELIWGQIGAALAAMPDADVIADCGRLGADGRFYDLVARADAVVLITRASLADMVRIRDRVAVVDAGIRRRHGPGRACVVVMADYKHFSAALGEVKQVLGNAVPAPIIGGVAYEPKSAELLSGEWGGKLDKSLLIRTARQVAAQLAGQLPAGAGAGAALPAGISPPSPVRADSAPPPMAPPPVQQPPVIPSPRPSLQPPAQREVAPPLPALPQAARQEQPPPALRPPAHPQSPQSPKPPQPPRRELPAVSAAPPPARETVVAETFPRWPDAQRADRMPAGERLQPLPPAQHEQLRSLPAPVEAGDDWNARQPAAEYPPEYGSSLGYPQHSNGARGHDQPRNGRYAPDPERTADLGPGLRQESISNGDRPGRGRHAGPPPGGPSPDQGRR